MIVAKLNRSLAKQDPTANFTSPFCVVDEKMFTRGEKIATLDRWRQAVVEDLVGTEGERARLLGEIEEARQRLSR